jgi:hypothetical protein
MSFNRMPNKCGVAIPGKKPNALGVKRRLADTETHIDTPPPTARCRFNSLLD